MYDQWNVPIDSENRNECESFSMILNKETAENRTTPTIIITKKKHKKLSIEGEAFFISVPKYTELKMRFKQK